MNNLHEALEVCLQEIELGADIETSLLRYPDFADELRPILQTSVHAKGLATSVPSVDMMQFNRAKLLRRAAEMRETQGKSTLTPSWVNPLRRAAVAFAIIAIIFMSGTGLVRASSTTLPGDNLYPVKRSYEDLALLFTFDSLRRNSLEVEYENERLEELHELIAKGRSAEVDFAGIVTQQNGSEWLVSGIRIITSSQTDLHDGPVVVGDAVRVFGITQSDTSVLAERIDQLPPNANLPDSGNSGDGSNSGSNSGSGSGNDNNGNDDANENDSSGPGNGNDNNNEDNSGPGGGNDNENNSGSGGSNDNDSSGPGSGNDNSNDNNSGSGSGSNNGNENNSGSGNGHDDSNDNGGEDNSGSGGGDDNSNENNSGPGGGGDD